MTEQPVYCNSEGCTAHDYQVADAWCAYQWAMSPRRQSTVGSRTDKLLDELVYMLEALTEVMKGQNRNPQYQRRSRPSPGAAASNRFGGMQIASKPTGSREDSGDSRSDFRG